MIKNVINRNVDTDTEAPIPASIQNYANKAVEGLPKIEPTHQEEEVITPTPDPTKTEPVESNVEAPNLPASIYHNVRFSLISDVWFST